MNLTITANRYQPIKLRFKEDGDYFDLTNYTVYFTLFVDTKQLGTVSQATHLDATNGLTQMNLPVSMTGDLDEDSDCTVEISVKNPAGKIIGKLSREDSYIAVDLYEGLIPTTTTTTTTSSTTTTTAAPTTTTTS